MRRLTTPLRPICITAALVVVLAMAVPGAAAAAASVTASVNSLAGWQSAHIDLVAGERFSVSTSGTWTVDYRNFPRVSAGGYSPSADAQIYQGCKFDSRSTYATLLAEVGTAGPVFAIAAGGSFTAPSTGTLQLRINDEDQCLVDNQGTVSASITPAPAGTTTTYSNNYAGYQVPGASAGADVHLAQAQLTQPAITCSAQDSTSEAAFWVGVGSRTTSSKTLSQVGTFAFCYGGKARYFLWWETVGRSAAEGGGDLQPVWQAAPPAVCQRPPTRGAANEWYAWFVDRGCTAPIAPGDRINLSTVVSAGHWAGLFAYDLRTGFQLNTTQTFTGAEADAANWVTEAPVLPGPSTAPLANFGTVTFSDCQFATGNAVFAPINALPNNRMILTSALLLPIRATPSSLSPDGTQFSVTWNHS